MTDYKGIAHGIRMAGAGYLLIYLNFNLNLSGFTLPLLPNVAGWLLLAAALRNLSVEAPTLKLILPFAGALGVWSLGQFFPTLELPAPLGWLSLGMSILQLYFHFQLFTDLAGVARKHLTPQSAGDRASTLLRARTVITLANALMFLPDLLTALPELLLFVLMAAWLAAGLTAVAVLFQLAGRFVRLCEETGNC